MQQIDHFQGNKLVLTSNPTPRVKGVGEEYEFIVWMKNSVVAGRE